MGIETDQTDSGFAFGHLNDVKGGDITADQ
jgi:hypothetical protein